MFKCFLEKFKCFLEECGASSENTSMTHKHFQFFYQTRLKTLLWVLCAVHSQFFYVASHFCLEIRHGLYFRLLILRSRIFALLRILHTGQSTALHCLHDDLCFTLCMRLLLCFFEPRIHLKTCWYINIVWRCCIELLFGYGIYMEFGKMVAWLHNNAVWL